MIQKRAYEQQSGLFSHSHIAECHPDRLEILKESNLL